MSRQEKQAPLNIGLRPWRVEGETARIKRLEVAAGDDNKTSNE